MNFNDRYKFDGTYNDFYSCYLDLVDYGILEPIN